MSKEAMKLALAALEGLEALLLSMGLTHLIVYGDTEKAITNLQKELANEALERMAENARELGLDYDANADHRLMENAQGDLERIKLVQTGVGIGKRKQEPEFFTHNVEQPCDWSEWVCPDSKSYLMKCCDCGLVHEAEFGVVRYKSETEREDCDIVDDPNLQAVFRMRRSEQWSPADTAHRAGGLPMAEQPAQTDWEALAADQAMTIALLKAELHELENREADANEVALTESGWVWDGDQWQRPPQRTWVGLTDEEQNQVAWFCGAMSADWLDFARAIEDKLKEKNT